MSIELHLGDCLEVMATLPDGCVDAVVTDPPYPEIDRAYGRMTEAEWWEMMMGVCVETRRLLKPTGSAVFILQPNSNGVGRARGWLWEFMAWVCREWNMVQDVWWWNYAAPPSGQSIQGRLLRPSLKACVWAGERDCYRDQDKVLRPMSERTREGLTRSNKKQKRPSGHAMNTFKMSQSAIDRGGSSPFNVLDIVNNGNGNANGHPAGTPLELAKWWTRYICPPGGTVCDPFVGSGTMLLAALEYGCSGVGIERDAGYFKIAQDRIAKAQMQMPLLEMV